MREWGRGDVVSWARVARPLCREPGGLGAGLTWKSCRKRGSGVKHADVWLRLREFSICWPRVRGAQWIATCARVLLQQVQRTGV